MCALCWLKRQYLISMLELEDYKENRIDTQWLDGLIAQKSINSRIPQGSVRYHVIVFGAVVKANSAITQLRNEAITALEYGRVPHDALLCTTFPVELILDGVKYVMTVRTTGEHDFAVELNGSLVNTKTHPLSDGRLLVFADGKTFTVFYEEDSTGLRLEIGNKGYTTVVFEKENDPTKLRATTTGKLVRFLVPDGEHVRAGQAFCEMEVMKMYMQLTTSHGGVLTHAANADSYVKAGDVIGSMDLDDKSSVSTADLYTGKLPSFKPPHMLGTRCHHRLRHALKRADAVISGFTDPIPSPDNRLPGEQSIVSQIMSALSDPSLPFLEVQEVFTTVRASLQTHIGDAIEEILQEMAQPAQSPLLGYGAAKYAAPSMQGTPAPAVVSAADGLNTEVQQQTISSVHKMMAILEPYQSDSRITRSVCSRPV
jgi:biotin carboxyl carrier protein